MAEAGDTGGNADVQAYLEEHRITSLFENLMSKIVKERPVDPIEFLIGKLQVIQRQRISKGMSPAHTASSTFASRSKIQVTGKSVTPKSSATTKARSTDHVTKSSSARPVKPKSTGMTSSSTSALKKSTPTKTTPSKKVVTPTRPVTSTGGPKTSTSTPKASRRPTTAPGVSRVTSSAAGKSSPAAKKKESVKPTSSLGKSPASSTSSLSKTGNDKEKTGASKKSLPATTHKVKEERRKKEDKETDTTRHTREASAEEISEFFGEAKKSSSRQLESDSEDDKELKEFGRERRDSESDESDAMEGVVRGVAKREEFDLEELIERRLRSKCGKKSHRLQSLLCPSPPEVYPSSLGYHSDSEGGKETDSTSGESDGVEVVEDVTALEDEGVTGLSRGKYAIHKSSPSSAKVDLKVVVCSRCARVIAGGDQTSEATASPTQLTESFTWSIEGDVESASQVGGQPTFPQWEAGSAVTGSEISRGSSGRSHDLSSDVTLQSCDTWGGLAPPTRTQELPTDTESELQLPPPLPLEGKSWLQDPSNQHDTHGWGATH